MDKKYLTVWMRLFKKPLNSEFRKPVTVRIMHGQNYNVLIQFFYLGGAKFEAARWKERSHRPSDSSSIRQIFAMFSQQVKSNSHAYFYNRKVTFKIQVYTEIPLLTSLCIC